MVVYTPKTPQNDAFLVGKPGKTPWLLGTTRSAETPALQTTPRGSRILPNAKTFGKLQEAAAKRGDVQTTCLGSQPWYFWCFRNPKGNHTTFWWFDGCHCKFHVFFYPKIKLRKAGFQPSYSIPTGTFKMAETKHNIFLVKEASRTIKCIVVPAIFWTSLVHVFFSEKIHWNPLKAAVEAFQGSFGWSNSQLLGLWTP